jgi:hypothetical protein
MAAFIYFLAKCSYTTRADTTPATVRREMMNLLAGVLPYGPR